MPKPSSPEELLVNDGTGRQPSILDEHAYLRERWNAGYTNAARLWQELGNRGYQGGPTYVRQYLARFGKPPPLPRRTTGSGSCSCPPIAGLTRRRAAGEQLRWH